MYTRRSLVLELIPADGVRDRFRLVVPADKTAVRSVRTLAKIEVVRVRK